MTDAQKAAVVSAMTEETDMDTISAYLCLAERKICNIVSPYELLEKVPPRYEHLQIEAAVYFLNKRGGEGETIHSENGITRHYETGDLPATLVKQIAPLCGVIK